MGFKCGIVGLPNVGKSTLFNALTASKNAEAANFPFCTIDPNIGIVDVVDKRLDKLSKLSNSKKKIYRSIKESEDMIERNFKVINLDVDNLAHYQVNKLEQKLENNEKTYNNINIHKLLNENAINSIDIYNTKLIYNRLLRC